MQESRSQFEGVGEGEVYAEAEAQVDGKRVHDLVLDPLPWDVRQLGTESDIFKTELEFHKKAAADKFIDLFVSTLHPGMETEEVNAFADP